MMEPTDSMYFPTDTLSGKSATVAPVETGLDRFGNAASATLSFTYRSGDVTAITPNRHVDWRRLPILVLSYIRGVYLIQPATTCSVGAWRVTLER
jgi:hypothetical protein